MTAVRAFPVYPIGTKGVAWTEAERQQWRGLQTIKRSYQSDVIDNVTSIFSKDAALAAVADIVPYGTIDYTSLGLPTYNLIAVKSKEFTKEKRTVVVTGGVHGYETSGVHGAIQFIREKFVQYHSNVNLLVFPCISPWGYETINRWNPNAVDPNRSFNRAAPGCEEAGNAMRFVAEVLPAGGDVIVHTDLHETTDTDNSEFTPAKFARDGTDPEEWTEIPDGFYVVGDLDRKDDQVEFLTTLIAAVKKVTHIAPADENNNLIGEPIVGEGIVSIPCGKLFLCASMTPAKYVTTTEVYPDSPKTNADECNAAQTACVVAAIDYALAKVL